MVHWEVLSALATFDTQFYKKGAEEKRVLLCFLQDSPFCVGRVLLHSQRHMPPTLAEETHLSWLLFLRFDAHWHVVGTSG